MAEKLSNNNWMRIFLPLLFFWTFFVPLAVAGTLSCTVRTSACIGDEIEIYEMEDTANSHAGLPAAAYNNLVCCGAVTGLDNSCSGTFATALKLSGTTNAHVSQGTVADYPGSANACISVPLGGSVVVGYQVTDCAGFDTMLGSMIDTENSHVGDSSWSAGTTKICASAHEAGTLSVDIVDDTGASVSNPAIVINSTSLSFAFQTVDGVFGTALEKIRVSNTTLNPLWTVSIAAADGQTALLSAGADNYDFNDPTLSAEDGADADVYGGQMTLNPSIGTLAGTCVTTGVTKGVSSSFSQGVTNSITLLTAGSSADSDCYWDFTGISVSQTIPPEQPANSYSIGMTLTVVAN